MTMHYNWNPEAPIHPIIIKWEQEWHLPKIDGTPKQQKYARDVRYRFLSKVFPNILKIRDSVDPRDGPIVFAELDRLRAMTSPSDWIELHQSKVDPVKYLLNAVYRHEQESKQQGDEIDEMIAEMLDDR